MHILVQISNNSFQHFSKLRSSVDFCCRFSSKRGKYQNVLSTAVFANSQARCHDE